MKLKVLKPIAFILMAINLTACAQVKQTTTVTPTGQLPWNGKQAAVVLTYDDGLNVHLNNAIPALDSVGLKGTFYIADFGNLRQQIPGWKKASTEGHELANHTVYHPCAGGPGRSWVNWNYDLNNYTIRRITDEARTMNTILHAIDGKSERTFAFPCSDTKIRDTPYINGLQNEFVAARAVRNEMPTIDKVQLLDVPCYAINGESAEKMIELVRQAIEKKALLVFLFHGVGGEHNLNVSLEAHSQLLKFLKQHQKELWIAPMLDVAKYIKTNGNK